MLAQTHGIHVTSATRRSSAGARVKTSSILAPPRPRRGRTLSSIASANSPAKMTPATVAKSFNRPPVAKYHRIMKHLREELWFKTPHRRDYINITEQIETLVKNSDVREGLVLV